MATKKDSKAKSQAERFLEIAKKAGADNSGKKFAQAMGRTTLARQGRKPIG